MDTKFYIMTWDKGKTTYNSEVVRCVLAELDIETLSNYYCVLTNILELQWPSES